MSTAAQKQFFASLAAFARATADLLDEMSKDTVTGAAPAKPEKPAPAPKAAKAPEKAAVETKPEPVKPVETKPAPAATNGAAGDIMAQCRSAAKSYAEVYGREGLKEVLKKYTENTLADVPPEKLPDLLKDLS